MKLKEILMNSKFCLFGGKGGVGKTSCAASSAIWAAEHGRNTLVISTDPAHSLADSFGLELSPGVPTPIEGIENLTALEINPEADMENFKNLLNVNPMGDMDMGGMMQGLGLGDIGDLASMSPPGIDETLAFAKVLEFIETDHNYDLIIFDTAPTGHTLRFLGLPETLSGWIGKLLKLRLKLGGIFGSLKSFFKREDKEEEEDNSLEMLERLNDSIARARDDLTDPSLNSFIIVMIPEEMAITETSRLLNQLIKYHIPISNIVVNQLYPQEEDLCDFCASRRRMQQRNLKKIREIFEDNFGKNIIEVPLFKEEIRKYEKLKEMGEYLIK
ncbi:MAG: ArsA family ATPase [Candidatus Lokiarchaeota archaeon]